MNAAVRMAGVTKTFGRMTAVAGLDLEVPRGGLYGFIGPNGAGKTTAIRMLMSMYSISPEAAGTPGNTRKTKRFRQLARARPRTLRLLEWTQLYPEPPQNATRSWTGSWTASSVRQPREELDQWAQRATRDRRGTGRVRSSP